MGVFSKVKPEAKIFQVRLIWPEIEAMRNHGLRYRQIVDVLGSDEFGYGIKIGLDRLKHACATIRKEIQVGKWSPEQVQEVVSESSEKPKPRQGREDVLTRLKDLEKVSRIKTLGDKGE